ncbi:Type IV secretion system protein virB1 [Xanthomonas citri pv. bilvae]|nr:Type IV secretion system protein virB1 [Xanthomonas citri pv. bilvae]
MAFRILGLLVGLFCAMMAPNAPAQSVQEFEALARQCAPSVHPATLAAVVKTESSFRPYAININGSRQLPRPPANQAEAIATAEYLLANGYNFDSGLGQINSTNVRKFGMAWTEVFEPCANLTAAARVLTECFVRASDGEPNDQAALRNALSCYNTGNFTRGHANGYIGRVERSAGTIPAAVVPALLPDGQSHEPAVATVTETTPPASRPIADVGPDAFGRGRSDAFGRASARSRMERELQSESAAITAASTTSTGADRPITLPGSNFAD